MSRRALWLALAPLLAGASCGPPALPWPASPLLRTERTPATGLTRAQALEQIVGRYAHFDVVAYQEPMRGAPMRTFIISYGFTEFSLRGGELVETDRFCHAEHRINRQGMESSLSDRATRAIKPPSQAVKLSEREGAWLLHRPATPSLIGAAGDPNQPLPKDPKEAQFTDPDGDGKPGVTVQIKANRWVKGQVYLARREIFENHLTLMSDGSILGFVNDRSEQLVAGASSFLFNEQADPKQVDDVGLNPIVLTPIPETLTDCDELMSQRQRWFPAAPAFGAKQPDSRAR